MEIVLSRTQKAIIKKNMNFWISGQKIYKYYEKDNIFTNGNGLTSNL